MPKNLFTPLEHLKKYAVFSKVTFQVLDWQIVGLIGEKCGRIQAQIILDIDENRTILINPTPLDVTFNGDEKQWLCADIQSGLPSLSAETQNEFIRQALNLQAIDKRFLLLKGVISGRKLLLEQNIVVPINVGCMCFQGKQLLHRKSAAKLKCS